MKRQLFFCITALIVLVSCTEENEPDGTILSVSPAAEPITFSASATESYTYTVTTNQESWEAVPNQQWCIVTKSVDGKSFTVTAVENLTEIEPPAAMITVKSGSAKPVTIAATQTAVQYQVYAAGYYSTPNVGGRPCYWVGTDFFALTDLPEWVTISWGRSIAVLDGKVYVAGYYDDAAGNRYACYWVDGVRTDLTDIPPEPPYSNAESMVVSDGKVYIGGWCSAYNACYWVDGVRTDLTTLSGGSSYGQSITVANGKVYVSGEYMKSPVGTAACYWVDGEHVDLEIPVTPYYYGHGRSIAVSEGKVYVAGDYSDGNKYVPCYWVDGVYRDLDVPTEARSGYGRAITVSDGKVYVAGNYTDENSFSVPCYWVDGTHIPLDPLAIGSNNSIVVLPGGTIYNVGRMSLPSYSAGYWKNGIFTELMQPKGSTYTIQSIILVRK